MSNNTEKSLIDHSAKDITATRAENLTDVCNSVTFHNGELTIYQDKSGRSRAQRTEIELVQGGTVIIYKDTGAENTKGYFQLAARFQKIELVIGETTHTLTVTIDPKTSAFNPLYYFFDGETQIGGGYGQSLDLRIASELLGENLGGLSDQAYGVTDWIKSKLASA